MIELSIIIVNYRGWRHLNECLSILSSFQTINSWFEVIVVDNYSNDNRLSDFKESFDKVRFFENSGNYGFSNGCNLGASKSVGNYLLFLNADIIITEQTLLELVEKLKKYNSFAALSCKHFGLTGRTEQLKRIFPDIDTIFGFTRAFKRFIGSDISIIDDDILKVDWVSGSVLIMSRETYNSISGWDDHLWLYYEDVDLCRRISQNIGLIGISTKSSVIHNHGGSTRINLDTTALTKAEVVISLHAYISLHFHKFKCVLIQFLIVFMQLIGRLVPVLLSYPFPFIPKLVLYRKIYWKLVKYYTSAIINKTWISPRSVKYKMYSSR